MLPNRTTILIVGAGPTGLAAAVTLAHQGFRDIVIVDAVERNSRPQSSRALAVHAATLEVGSFGYYHDFGLLTSAYAGSRYHRLCGASYSPRHSC